MYLYRIYIHLKDQYQQLALYFNCIYIGFTSDLLPCYNKGTSRLGLTISLARNSFSRISLVKLNYLCTFGEFGKDFICILRIYHSFNKKKLEIRNTFSNFAAHQQWCRYKTKALYRLSKSERIHSLFYLYLLCLLSFWA